MINGNAQAIILLTFVHSQSPWAPLSAPEYSKIAYRIKDSGLTGPQDLLPLSAEEISNTLQIEKEEAERIRGLLDLGGTASLYLERLMNQGIQLITRTDSDYPAEFKQLLRENTPPYLSYVGNLDLLAAIPEACILSATDIDKLSSQILALYPRNLICLVDSAYHLKQLSDYLRNWDKIIIISSIGLGKMIRNPLFREFIRDGKLLILSTNSEEGSKPNYHNLYLLMIALAIPAVSIVRFQEHNLQIKQIIERLRNNDNLKNKLTISELQTGEHNTPFVKIERWEEVMNTAIEPDEPKLISPTIYSIGHSNHEIGKFLELLEQHGIEMLVDIRSVPSSKYSSQFDQAALRQSLKDLGIGYKYLGKSLGGRPEDSLVLNSEGKIIRELIEQKDWYQRGIKELIETSRKHKRIAFMCSEEDPTHCHRGYIVSNTLIAMGIRVLHIRASGEAQELGLLDSPADQMEIPL